MRRIAWLIAIVFVFGCTMTVKKIEELKPGMTKAQVEEILGKPQGYKTTGPTEIYNYYNLTEYAVTHDYSLMFYDGKLKEWWRSGSYRPPQVTGAVISVPANPVGR